MNENIIKARGAHPFGLKWLARTDGPHADMLMDFGVYRMKKGDPAALNAYNDEYMKQYSWAEMTAGMLVFHLGRG